MTKISILLIFLLLIISCGQRKAENAAIFDFSHVCDTTGFVNFIKSNHENARRQINKSLYQYLNLKAQGDTLEANTLGRSLEWLIDIYEPCTSIEDFNHKFRLFRSWNKDEIYLKLGLDSNLNSHPKTFSKNWKFPDSLLTLRTKFDSLHDSFCLATINFEISKGYYEKQKIDSAESYLILANDMASNIGFLDLLGSSELLRAKIFQIYKADYFNAEKAIRHSITISNILGSRYLQTSALSYQGYFYLQLFQTQKAIRIYKSLLPMYEEIKNPNGEALCLYYLAELFCDQGKYDSALYYGKLSLDKRHKLANGNPILLANIGYSISCLGFVYQALNDTTVSAGYYYLADSIFKAAGDSTGLILNLIRNASLSVQQNNYIAAESLYNAVIECSSRFEEMHSALYGLALCKYYKCDKDEAQLVLKTAINLVENAYQKLPVPEIKIGVLSDKIGMYNLLVNIFIDYYSSTNNREFLDSVIKYDESGRARALFEMISSRSDGDLFHNEEILVSKISELYKSKLMGGNRDRLSSDIAGLEDSLMAMKFRGYEEDYSKNIPSPISKISATVIQNQTIKSGEIILDYLISQFGSYVICIDRDTILLHKIDAPLDSLENMVGEYLLNISVYPGSNRISNRAFEIGRKLYDALIPKKLLKEGKYENVLVVQSSYLCGLPLETLIDRDSSFMIEHYNITYLPSLTILCEIRNRPALMKNGIQKKIAAFGAPVFYNDSTEEIKGDQSQNLLSEPYAELGIVPLNHSREEIDFIGSLFGAKNSDIFMAGDCSETTFKKLDFTKYNIIHLSTHGLTDYNNPEHSAIVFSMGGTFYHENDGLLQALEISHLEMAANTIFLSACNTGQGQSLPGEGTMNLARPFLVAGCKAAIVASWNLDDNSASIFVRQFYTNIKNGNPVSSALSLAKKNLINSEYNHPYFWAPYIIIGTDN